MTKRVSYSILLMLFFISYSCRSGHKVVLTAENIVSDHLNTDASMCLMVISDERKGQAWYITQKTWRIATIKNIPETALHNVWQVAISPKDEYLAVLSEGEGHPIVDIFKLKTIFRPRNGLEDAMIPPVLTIDPYPGTIWIRGWQSDACLLIESDVPLTLLDKKKRRVPLLEPGSETQTFSWDISNDAIVRK